MSPRPLNELVSPDWAEALQPVAATITAMGRSCGPSWPLAALPAGVSRCCALHPPLSQVKVLIVGQDPYTPGTRWDCRFQLPPTCVRSRGRCRTSMPSWRLILASVRPQAEISSHGSNKVSYCSIEC